jgi:hypothetical protein
MLGEALGAVAALQQEGIAGGDVGERTLQLVGLAGEDKRRERASTASYPGTTLPPFRTLHRRPAFWPKASPAR